MLFSIPGAYDTCHLPKSVTPQEKYSCIVPENCFLFARDDVRKHNGKYFFYTLSVFSVKTAILLIISQVIVYI